LSPLGVCDQSTSWRVAYIPSVMQATAQVDSDRLALTQHELAALRQILGSEGIIPVVALHQCPAILHQQVEEALVEAGHAA
jgi:hypothetical protein